MGSSISYQVGVLFGGRSSEHEVSLASARNVMDALQGAGHTVVPIGITQQGAWLTSDEPLAQLTDAMVTSAAVTSAGVANGVVADGQVTPNGPDGQDTHLQNGAKRPTNNDTWALLPHARPGTQLPSIDVIFPMLHGPYGEDGTVQGLLEMANLPYVGCGVLGSALAMDKAVAKRLFALEGLPQARWQLVMRRTVENAPEETLDQILADLTLPLFVKPANLGSSVGVSKANSRVELLAAIKVAAVYDRKIIVEEAVSNAREIEVSILGNDEPLASVPGEIIPGSEFYDYDAKYIDSSSELVIPARIDEKTTQQIQQMAIQAFRAVDGTGLARVDFLLDDHSRKLYLNEVNTMPGFTRISMYPKLWEASGISYPDLVDKLLHLAVERYQERQENCTTRR